MYIVKREPTNKKGEKCVIYFCGTIHFFSTAVITSGIESEAKVFVVKSEAEAAAIIMGKGAEVVEKIYK